MNARNDSAASARIDDLEARVAFQERELEQLAELVDRQRQEIARLVRQLEVLGQRTRELAERLADESDDSQPPPHY